MKDSDDFNTRLTNEIKRRLTEERRKHLLDILLFSPDYFLVKTAIRYRLLQTLTKRKEYLDEQHRSH